jgi:hypothetical protein
MENCLDVAIRWGNKQVVEYYLKANAFSTSDVKRGYRVCESQEMHGLLSTYVKPPSRFWKILACCKSD